MKRSAQNVIDFLLLLIILLALSTLSAFAQQQEFVVMDFEDAVLHDDAWALTQPYGTYQCLVRPKSDSGPDDLSLAVGAGRHGGNALLVQSTNSSMGLPGFWVIKGKVDHGWLANPNNAERHILPRGMRANRIEFWLRFEQGYRFTNASAQPPAWPNHQNMHFGTYHDDPVVQDTNPESHNWHFYHHLFLRHDLAGTNWIHVVLNEQPQHQRSLTALPPYNPTLPKGNYWELLTRFYIDGHTYFSDPEINYPIKMWVDDIKLSYIPLPNDIDVCIEDYVPGQSVILDHAVTKDFNITVRNRRTHPVTGRLALTTPYWFNPEILEQSGATAPSYVTVSPNSISNFILRLRPKADLTTNRTDNAGFMFVPTNQFVNGTTYCNRSFSDKHVEKRWYPEQGGHDATVYGTFMRVTVNRPTGNNDPIILGGRTHWTLENQPMTGQVTSSDPEDDAIVFTVATQDHTNVVMNSLSGEFTFNPDNGFTGIYSFTCMDASGTVNSNDVAFWINVVPDLDGDQLPDAWEMKCFSNLNYNAADDPDRDRYSNSEEYLAGTMPNIHTSCWTVALSHNASSFDLSFPAHMATDTGYEGRIRHVGIFQSTALMNPSWLPVSGFEDIVSTGQTVSCQITNGPATGFYTVKAWFE